MYGEPVPTNFDQAKALRLQQWRSILDDHDFRQQNPEDYRQTLNAMSATQAAEGLIDTLQQFDLNERANAAYWHAVEESQTAPGRYCGASAYDVLQHGSNELLGKIGCSIFYAASTLAPGARSSYDGKIYRDATSANLVFTPSEVVARIIGLTLTLPDTQQYDLVETGRTIEGVAFEPIKDPDHYRALVDVAQVAQECRDLRAFERLRPLIDLARFCPCPSCLDRLDRREDCPTWPRVCNEAGGDRSTLQTQPEGAIMCERLSQSRGIHDFVAALSITNALLNYAGDQPFERSNAAPTTQLALFHRDGEYLRADMARWD